MCVFVVYLIFIGLWPFLPILNQHYENTKKVINFLKKQRKVKEILYPHKPSSKNDQLWKKYYSGATGLLSIVLKSKKKSSGIKFVNSLELFGSGYSWGNIINSDIFIWRQWACWTWCWKS